MIFFQVPSSVWLNLLLKQSSDIFNPVIVFFSSRISIWFLLSFSLLILPLCSWTVFLILHSCLSVFSCRPLSFKRKKQKKPWIPSQEIYRSLCLWGWFLEISFIHLIGPCFPVSSYACDFFSGQGWALCIWKTSHTSQSLWTGFVQGKIFTDQPG